MNTKTVLILFLIGCTLCAAGKKNKKHQSDWEYSREQSKENISKENTREQSSENSYEDRNQCRNWPSNELLIMSG
jgi:hypothetical protein